MSRKTRLSTDFTDLRRQAEAKYHQHHTEPGAPLREAELQRLVHELEVHQIELEMQNEELQQARAEIEAGLERYTDLYDFAPVGYFTLRRDGTVSQVNLSGSLMLGIERAQLVGKGFGLFVADSDELTFNRFLEKVFKSHAKQMVDLRLRKADAGIFWVQIEAIAVSEWQECRAVVMDIQARKLAETKLEHLSMHDLLTGLYNRGYFIESLTQLERGRHFPISILMADVDHLKDTNDQEGHAAGDDILTRVAGVLNMAFRTEDVIARIGGDEFAVLLPDTSAKAAEVALRRLFDILQEHNTDYFTKKPIQLSFGMATAAEYGNSLLETLKEAEKKMDQQKRR